MPVSDYFSKGQALALFARAAHSHAAGDITSGVLDNARVDWASPGAIGGTTPALGTFTRLSAIYDEASPATATFYPISSARNNAANRGVALGIQTRSDNNTVRGGAVQAVGNGQLFIGVPSAPYAIQINGAEGNIIIGATSTQLNFTERMILHGALVLQSGAGLDTPNTTYPKIIGGSSVMGTNSDLLLIARNSSSNGHIGFITGAAGGQAGVRMSVRADGTVHIGTWHTPAALLSVLLNDTGTNDIVNVGIIGRRSSNTPAADFGAALLYQLKSSTTNDQNVAAWIAAWGNATHLSRTGKLIGRVWNIGTPVDVLTLTPNGASIGSAQAFYFGAEATDGTWRIIRDGTGLKFQRRESGSYVDKSTIAA